MPELKHSKAHNTGTRIYIRRYEIKGYKYIERFWPIGLSINVAIPWARNVTQRDAENKLQHKHLSTKIQRMWKMKSLVIPVIIGATGIETKGLKSTWKQYQENIP
jgi:hypothetical protein